MRSPDAVAPEFVAKVQTGRLIAQVKFYAVATYDRILLHSEIVSSVGWMHMRSDLVYVHAVRAAQLCWSRMNLRPVHLSM